MCPHCGSFSTISNNSFRAALITGQVLLAPFSALFGAFLGALLGAAVGSPGMMTAMGAITGAALPIVITLQSNHQYCKACKKVF